MLAVILGNAELALDEVGEGDDTGHQIGQILKASKRARDLVKQILTFSRKGPHQRQPLKVVPLVKETAKLLRGSLPSTIDIEVDAHTEIDTILADPSQIQQVIMNLSTNAAHAMSEEGGTLSISVSDVEFSEEYRSPHRDMQPGQYLVLAVSDTGTGMPKEVCDRIFEPFFTTKEPGQGTGMGLAVVYGIVKKHGGVVTVESSPGKGSLFKVFFPSHDGAASQERIGRGNLPRGSERLLVVDDEPSVVEIASETLKRLGYQVTTAESGPAGWKTFEEAPQRFDLVITDHVMPEITGMRLAEKMLEIRRDLPIILFTGYTETVTPEKAREKGISEFLLKPVVARELAETVRRVLDGRSGG
jgi:two-component system cell cycle sensor histidine kinase/response regulator CckA